MPVTSGPAPAESSREAENPQPWAAGPKRPKCKVQKSQETDRGAGGDRANRALRVAGLRPQRGGFNGQNAKPETRYHRDLV